MKNNKCEYIYIIFIEMKRNEFYYRLFFFEKWISISLYLFFKRK